MYHYKCEAYCLDFSVPKNLFKVTECLILSVYGNQHHTMGTSLIPIPFKETDDFLDFNFLILDTNLPSILSNRDLQINSLVLYTFRCSIFIFVSLFDPIQTDTSHKLNEEDDF